MNKERRLIFDNDPDGYRDIFMHATISEGALLNIHDWTRGVFIELSPIFMKSRTYFGAGAVIELGIPISLLKQIVRELQEWANNPDEGE
jgi:hypothetical protein